MFFHNTNNNIENNKKTLIKKHNDWTLISDEYKIRNFHPRKNKVTEQTNKALTYEYKGILLLKFLFDGYQLAELEFNVDVIQRENITPLPNAIFDGPLINLILTKIKGSMEVSNDTTLCKEIATNYFSGPIVDFLNYKHGHSITFERGHSHEPKLRSILEAEGITVCENPFYNEESITWLRDNFIALGKNYLVRSNTIGMENKYFLDDVLELNPSSDFQKTCVELHNETMGSAIEDNDDHEIINEILYKNKIKHSQMEALLENGNFITMMIDGKIKVIMGVNSVAIESIFLMQEEQSDDQLVERLNQNEDSKPFYQSLKNNFSPIRKGHLKEAKYVIAKTLKINPKQLICVPNLFFHNDMRMTAGPKCIFLNSFSLIANILQNTQDPLLQNIAACAAELHGLYGHLHEKTKAILEAEGIKVVEIPGVIYFRTIDAQGQSKLICLANFMNAHTGKGKNGNFYITAVPVYPIQLLQEYFEFIVKQNDINNIHYVGTPINVNDLLNECNGLWRCLSIPGNQFIKLQVNRENQENAKRKRSFDIHSLFPECSEFKDKEMNKSKNEIEPEPVQFEFVNVFSNRK